ncbi:MAG TPA: hypothetical protein VGW78_06880 [Candidatus Babeliales bacterium]|jgi:hypothetical protein|nr:hypothetical protein [Candidatus Babeliales bacterium]
MQVRYYFLPLCLCTALYAKIEQPIKKTHTSPIPLYTKREISMGIGGFGLGLLLKRHPIIGLILTCTGYVGLSGNQYQGIDTLQEGVNTLYNAQNTDDYVEGITQSGKGLYKIGKSLIADAAGYIHTKLSDQNNA